MPELTDGDPKRSVARSDLISHFSKDYELPISWGQPPGPGSFRECLWGRLQEVSSKDSIAAAMDVY